jgi:hypothetical protein
LKGFSGYIYNRLKADHPTVSWCVEAYKCEGEVTQTTFLWRSSHALQFLTFRLGDHLFFRVYASKSKLDEKELDKLK